MSEGVFAAAAAGFFVALMGFAIQRGATCTVAAVDEVLNQRRATRLLALLEASLWVAGGLAVARAAGWLQSLPASYEAGRWTVLGGLLLGLGAWVNRACVFGAVARLGNGEWAYAATPLGFYLGCLSVMPLFARPQPGALAAAAAAGPGWPASIGPGAAAALFAVFALVRLGGALWHGREALAALHRRLWSPHAATVVIGVCFVATLLLAGRWAYTDVLADLAQAMSLPMPGRLGLPVLLLLALYGGALVGGRSAGRWRPARVAPAALLRCLAGGVVMGWGSLLIPGSNDGLILIGMPLLRPYAWLAFAVMFAAIAAAMRLQRGFARPA